MRKSLKIFAIIICILAIASVGFMVYMAFNSDIDVFYKVEVVSNIIALLFVFEYIILGFKKDFASYYKLAMYVNAANALIVTAVASNESTKYIAIISCAICFGCILTLAVAKNLGKKMSLILCTVVILLRISGIISYYFSANTVDISLIIMISQLVLALVILVATIAKYEDKTIRHTV